jgi:hypothetical protein
MKPKWVKGKYHYHVVYDECVLCGRTYVERWRVKGPRHKRRWKCIMFKQHACGGHFL